MGLSKCASVFSACSVTAMVSERGVEASLDVCSFQKPPGRDGINQLMRAAAVRANSPDFTVKTRYR